MIDPRIMCAAALCLAALMGLPAASEAQEYPSRPITLIVPYPAGGGSDGMARVVADRLSTALGQQIIIDNRGTGGGNVGTRVAAKAPPDGYTLLLGHTGTITINPVLYTNAGYEPEKDFLPIGTIGSIPLALIVHPSHPAKSVTDLIAMAKAEPGKVALGASAIGTGSYMSAQLFKEAAGIDINIISYRGLAPFLTDILGGHVPVGFSVTPPAYGNIQNGNLRAIAVSSAKRLASFPGVPTVAESGLPGFESSVIYGLFAPAGVSPSIIEKVSKALKATIEDKNVHERILTEGGEPLVTTPAEYAEILRRDSTKWTGVIRRLNLKIEN
jgi:tripartite-type tricarboxylate transporter receptor subunit TctC